MMITEDFCSFLEYELSAAFEHSRDKAVRFFWCDGIVLDAPDRYYAKKYINDNRQTILRAYVGVDGQTQYELIMKFGPKALSRYQRDLSLEECVPDPATPNWFTIDVEKQVLTIQLL